MQSKYKIQCKLISALTVQSSQYNKTAGILKQRLPPASTDKLAIGAGGEGIFGSGGKREGSRPDGIDPLLIVHA